MVDMEKVEQCRAIANALHRIAPPGRRLMANELFDLGVRIHPELATKQLVSDVPEQVRKQLGNWAPQRLDAVQTVKEIVEHVNPALAKRIENAKTDAEKAELRDEVYAQNRAVIDNAGQQLASAKPEDLE
jgi:hypothetical protein